MYASPELLINSIHANDYEFTFIECGEGPLILFLHGFPDHPYSFQLQMTELSKEGFHCVAPFKRGFTPGDTTVYPVQHFSKYVQDVVCLIDAFKTKQVVLVGHDWGAGAAYGVAKYAPEKIKAIITMSVPLSPAFFKSYTENLKQIKRSWYLFFFQSQYAIDGFRNNDYAIIDEFYKDWSPDWKHNTEYINSVKDTFRKPGSVESAVGYYRQSFGTYQLEDTELIKIQNAFLKSEPFVTPTLYIHGENDGCIGVENMEGMEFLFSSTFHKQIIPHTGHFVHMENPRAVTQLMISTLRNLG